MLERKQPYSGDEWCSGPDSEEDDKPIAAPHSEFPSCAPGHGLPCPHLGACRAAFAQCPFPGSLHRPWPSLHRDSPSPALQGLRGSPSPGMKVG